MLAKVLALAAAAYLGWEAMARLPPLPELLVSYVSDSPRRDIPYF